MQINTEDLRRQYWDDPSHKKAPYSSRVFGIALGIG